MLSQFHFVVYFVVGRCCSSCCIGSMLYFVMKCLSCLLSLLRHSLFSLTLSPQPPEFLSFPLHKHASTMMVVKSMMSTFNSKSLASDEWMDKHFAKDLQVIWYDNGHTIVQTREQWIASTRDEFCRGASSMKIHFVSVHEYGEYIARFHTFIDGKISGHGFAEVIVLDGKITSWCGVASSNRIDSRGQT